MTSSFLIANIIIDYYYCYYFFRRLLTSSLIWQVWILCNDCGATSEVKFHVVAQKCLNCKSYNTRQTKGTLATSSCSDWPYGFFALGTSSTETKMLPLLLVTSCIINAEKGCRAQPSCVSSLPLLSVGYIQAISVQDIALFSFSFIYVHAYHQ